MAPRCWLLLALAVSGAGQTPQSGSISGVIRDAGTGTALRATVSVPLILPEPDLRRPFPSGLSFATPSALRPTITVESGSDGHYTMTDVPPGRYTITAVVMEDRRGVAGKASRSVTVNPGQELTGIDIAVPSYGIIAGRVLDADRHPMPNVSVLLEHREYRSGILQYRQDDSKITDEKGAYQFSVESGRSYILAVYTRRMTSFDDPVPENPKEREPEMPRTYYPGTTYLDAAAPLVLRPGEFRDGTDIRVVKSTAYCIDGVIDTTAMASVKPNYTLDREDADAVFRTVDGGLAATNGTFRACHLFPGTYRVSTRSAPGPGKTDLGGITQVTVRDADLHDIRLPSQPLPTVVLRWDWDGPPPADPELHGWGIALTSMQNFVSMMTRGSGDPPRTQFMHQMPVGDYTARFNGLSKGDYVKDLLVGAVSYLRKPVIPWSSMLGGAAVRFLIAHDGGAIGGKVTDKDGNPIADLNVYILPEDASTPAELSLMMTSVTTDQNGVFLSGTLAPGKYQVLATNTPLFPTPEHMAKLLRERAAAQEVEVRPNGTAQATVAPITVQ